MQSYKHFRRQRVFDKIENSKVGDILPESDIYNYVEYLHGLDNEDFEYGDIVERIEEFSSYQLQEVNISDINIGEFGVDWDIVDNYAELIKQSNKYPYVILSDTYRIIDGAHRLNALSELGYKKVLAFVGIK